MLSNDPGLGWERVNAKMRVVRLGLPVLILLPALIVPSLSKGTRGLTLYPGKMGLALGALVLASSALLGSLLWRTAGVLGVVASGWVLGTIGAVTLVSAVLPVAFVKPICVKCRLLPVIREHEAIHLTGVSSESAVWGEMRNRHSAESLALAGDPAICSFCPIPRRLSGN